MSPSSKNIGTGTLLVYLVLIVTLVVGWIMNLYTVIHMALDGASLTTLFVLRIVGIFVFFLGGIIGYF